VELRVNPVAAAAGAGMLHSVAVGADVAVDSMRTGVNRTVDARPLEDAIRAIPPAWFQPSKAVYWADLAASAGIGWVSFAAAVESPGWLRAVLLVIATAALYRAVLFIHEITHRAARDVPLFRTAWNVTVGIPLLLPSFLYEGVHTDHHRQRCYGTDADPEYVPFGRRGPAVVARFVVLSLLAPLVFAVRFAVLAPLSWVVPPLRRVTRERASALVINSRYIRRGPLPSGAVLQEAAACTLVWTAAWLWRTERFSTTAILCWTFAAAAGSFVNAVRTIAAHRYENDDGELSMLEQLLDSCTIAANRGRVSLVADLGHVLVAPVGLRFHALHHWIPALPYHNLGRVHRRLVAVDDRHAPYQSTIAGGFAPVIRDLLRRSRRRS
jgi:fatty acid desaturase